jgi:hypothetical protein
MNGRNMYLLGMLVLLFLANLAMLMGLTNWPQRVREGFVEAVATGQKVGGSSSGAGASLVPGVVSPGLTAAGGPAPAGEGFMDYLQSGGFGTASIGPYDGQNMAANLPPAAQGFRQKMPNVPLAGPEVEIGPDHLFYFANNECKPECCGATLSCDGGCVCTTPGQRDFINTRGGNRKHEDGF